MLLTESQLRSLVKNLIQEQDKTPGNAPGKEQVHLFDFDDTLGVTTNANAVMLYRDGKPIHGSKADVENWLKTYGISKKDLLDPGIVSIKEKKGAYAAYITSAALAKIQSKIPRESQFVTGFSTPQGKTDGDEVLIDFTPSSSTDIETTKPIKSTIEKLKKANAAGSKTAVVTARSDKGEVIDIHGDKIKATNSEDMEKFLAKMGAKPTAGVFGVSGGNKGEKIKNEFVPEDDPPEEIHFYDDLSKNTIDVAGALGEKVPSEVYIYGPGDFDHNEADPNKPNQIFPAKGKKQKNESKRLTADPLLERWLKIAGIK